MDNFFDNVDALAARLTRLAGLTAVTALIAARAENSTQQLLDFLHIDVIGLAGTLASLAVIFMIITTLLQGFGVGHLLGSSLGAVELGGSGIRRVFGRLLFALVSVFAIVANGIVFSVIYGTLR